MSEFRLAAILTAVLLSLAGLSLSQSTPQQTAAPKTAAPKTASPAAPSAAPKAAAPKAAPAAPAALSNQDIVRLVQAKLPDDLIVSKIKTSKTRFDTSVDAIIALKSAGLSDRLIGVMMNPAAAEAAPAVAARTSGRCEYWS